MPKLDRPRLTTWTRELLAAAIWTVVVGLALFVIFALLGGTHGSGGALLTVATVPIGMLHWIGVGGGLLSGIIAVFTEFGFLLIVVSIVRAIWRTIRLNS